MVPICIFSIIVRVVCKAHFRGFWRYERSAKFQGCNMFFFIVFWRYERTAKFQGCYMFFFIIFWRYERTAKFQGCYMFFFIVVKAEWRKCQSRNLIVSGIFYLIWIKLLTIIIIFSIWSSWGNSTGRFFFLGCDFSMLRWCGWCPYLIWIIWLLMVIVVFFI